MEQSPLQTPRSSPQPVWGLGEETYKRNIPTAPTLLIKTGRNFAEEKASLISFVGQPHLWSKQCAVLKSIYIPNDHYQQYHEKDCDFTLCPNLRQLHGYEFRRTTTEYHLSSRLCGQWGK